MEHGGPTIKLTASTGESTGFGTYITAGEFLFDWTLVLLTEHSSTLNNGSV